MKSIDIFIKSYKPDFWLLQLALKTITRNVTGYKNIRLLIPEKDKHEFDTRDLPPRTYIHYVDDKEPGYLYQQVCKLQAYKYSEADFTLFTDSDAFWPRPINIQTLIKGGKPEILFTDYKQLPDAIIWKEPTERLVGSPVEFEYMRRLPLVYHNSTLAAINKWKPDLEELVMNSERFSEFNLIGAYAAKFEKEKYTWTNTDNWTYVESPANQVWSHASKEPGADELHLREYIRTLETLLKAFDIVIP